jgi:hypothetical protein
MRREDYSKDQPIGEMTQDDFNIAMHHALQSVGAKKTDNIAIIGSILFLILMVWAVILAMRVKNDNAPLHIGMAVLVPPVYIIAHYLGRV